MSSMCSVNCDALKWVFVCRSVKQETEIGGVLTGHYGQQILSVSSYLQIIYDILYSSPVHSSSTFFAVQVPFFWELGANVWDDV